VFSGTGTAPHRLAPSRVARSRLEFAGADAGAHEPAARGQGLLPEVPVGQPFAGERGGDVTGPGFGRPLEEFAQPKLQRTLIDRVEISHG